MSAVAPPLSSKDLATLQTLAASPAAAAMVEQRERQRAADRSALLARQVDEETASRASLDASAQVLEARRAEVARLSALLASAQAGHRAAEVEVQSKGYQREIQANLANVALGPLGGDAIDTMLGRVRFGVRAAQGDMHWRDQRDAYGTITDVVLADGAPLSKLQAFEVLALELEAMRRSPDLTPATIEARCAEIGDWIDAGAHPHKSIASRVDGLALFTRIWRRAAAAGGRA